MNMDYFANAAWVRCASLRAGTKKATLRHAADPQRGAA